MGPPEWAVLSGFQPAPDPFAEAEETLEEAEWQDPWREDPFAAESEPVDEPPEPPEPPVEDTGPLHWADVSKSVLEGLPGRKELESTRLFRKLDENEFNTLIDQNRKRARTEELDWFSKTRGLGGRGRRTAEAMPYAGVHTATRLMDTAMAAYEWEFGGIRTEEGARLIGEFYAELERAEGLTKWDHAAELAGQMPGFFTEIYLSGGGYTIVSKATKQGLLRTLRKMGVRFLKEKVEGVAKRKLLPKAAIKFAGFAVGSGALTALNPQLIAEQTSERALHHALRGDEEAFVKAMWQGPLGAYFELSSEMSGGIGAKYVTGYLAKKLGIKKMMEAAAHKWLIANPRSRMAHFLALRNKVGWHGILEEIEEERLVDVMRGLAFEGEGFGTSGALFSADPKERSKAWEQIEIEFYAFSVVGGSMRAPGLVTAFKKAPIEKMEQFGKNPSRTAWNKIEGNYRALTEEQDGTPLATAPLPIIGQTYDLPTKDEETGEVDSENLTPQELDPKEAHHRKWMADNWVAPMAEAQLEGQRQRYKEHFGVEEPAAEPEAGPAVVEEEGVLAGVEDVPEGEAVPGTETDPGMVSNLKEKFTTGELGEAINEEYPDLKDRIGQIIDEVAAQKTYVNPNDLIEDVRQRLSEGWRLDEPAEEAARGWQVGDTVQAGPKKAVKSGQVVRVLGNGNLEVQIPGEAETRIFGGEDKTLELVSPAEAAAEPVAEPAPLEEAPAQESAQADIAAVNESLQEIQREIATLRQKHPKVADKDIEGMGELIEEEGDLLDWKKELQKILSAGQPAPAVAPGEAPVEGEPVAEEPAAPAAAEGPGTAAYHEWKNPRAEIGEKNTSFLTGKSDAEIREAAKEEAGLGLLVTPKTGHYVHKNNEPEAYSHIAVDNGAFQAEGFKEKAFYALLKKIKNKPEVMSRVIFVTAPDVVEDWEGTLELFKEHAQRIRDMGFPVALALQDGLVPENIPWGEFDVLFIGGSDGFKLGDALGPVFMEAIGRGVHVHMGRVNSAKRMGYANWAGAGSADGTTLLFGKKNENLPVVLGWLEKEAKGENQRLDPADDPIYDQWDPDVWKKELAQQPAAPEAAEEEDAIPGEPDVESLAVFGALDRLARIGYNEELEESEREQGRQGFLQLAKDEGFLENDSSVEDPADFESASGLHGWYVFGHGSVFSQLRGSAAVLEHSQSTRRLGELLGFYPMDKEDQPLLESPFSSLFVDKSHPSRIRYEHRMKLKAQLRKFKDLKDLVTDAKNLPYGRTAAARKGAPGVTARIGKGKTFLGVHGDKKDRLKEATGLSLQEFWRQITHGPTGKAIPPVPIPEQPAPAAAEGEVAKQARQALEGLGHSREDAAARVSEALRQSETPITEVDGLIRAAVNVELPTNIRDDSIAALRKQGLSEDAATEKVDELLAKKDYTDVGDLVRDAYKREEVAPKQYTKREMVEGDKAEVLVQDGEKTRRIPATYALVSLDDLTPSHDATMNELGGVSALRNRNYPDNLQPRHDYTEDPQSVGSAKVARHAAQKVPEYYINNVATPLDGPPTVTPEGLVINGNGRAMTLQVAYGEWYQQYLKDNAETYGLTEEQVSEMNQPVLVRVVDMHPESPEAKTFARLGNIGTAQAQSPAEIAASYASMIFDEDLTKLLDLESGDTIKALISGDKAKDFRKKLRGRMPASQRNEYFNKDGTLNEKGRELVRDMFVAHAFPVELINTLRQTEGVKDLLGNMIGVVPELLAIQANYPQYDTTAALIEAVEWIARHKDTAISRESVELRIGRDLFGELEPGSTWWISPQGRMMLDLLVGLREEGKSWKFPIKLRKKFKGLASTLKTEKGGMFAEEAGPIPETIGGALGVPVREGADFSVEHEPVAAKFAPEDKAEADAEALREAEEKDAALGPRLVESIRAYLEGNEELQDTIKDKFGLTDWAEEIANLKDDVTQLIKIGQEIVVKGPKDARAFFADVLPKEDMPAKGETTEEADSQSFTDEETERQAEELTVQLMGIMDRIAEMDRQVEAAFKEGGEDLRQQTLNEASFRHRRARLEIWKTVLEDRWAKLFGVPTGAGLGVEARARQNEPGYKSPVDVTSLGEEEISLLEMTPEEIQSLAYDEINNGELLTVLLGLEKHGVYGVHTIELEESEEDPFTYAMIVPMPPSANRDNVREAVEQHAIFQVMAVRPWGEEVLLKVALQEEVDEVLSLLEMSPDKSPEDFVQSFADAVEQSVPSEPTAKPAPAAAEEPPRTEVDRLTGEINGLQMRIRTIEAKYSDWTRVEKRVNNGKGSKEEKADVEEVRRLEAERLEFAKQRQAVEAAEEEGLFGVDPSPPRPRRPAAGEEAVPEEGEPRLFDVARPQTPLPAGAVLGVHDFWTYEDPQAGSGRPIAIWSIIRRLSKLPRLFGYKGVTDFPIQTGAMKSPGALGETYWQELMVKIRNADDMLTAFHEIGHAIEVLIFGTGLVKDPVSEKVSRTSPWKSAAVGKEVVEELSQLGVDLWGEGKTPKGGLAREGFAEFIRLYLENRSDVETKAPNALKWFEAKVAGRPNGRKALKEMNLIAGMVTSAREQGLLNWARANVVVDPASLEVRFQEFKDMMRLSPQSLTRLFVDALQPLELFEMQYEKTTGEKVDRTKSAYMWGQALRLQHSAVVHQMVNDGMVDFNRTLVKDGVSLRQMEKFVNPKELHEFSIYLVARRSLKLIHNEKITWDKDGNITSREPDPLPTGMTELQATGIIDKLEKMYPLPGSDRGRFGAAADIYYKWNDGVLQYVAESDPFLGAIVERIRRKEKERGDYAPLRRYMRTTNLALAQHGGPRVSYTDVFDVLKGSELISVVDPIQTAVSNAERLILAAHNRKVVGAMISMAGGYSDKLDEPLGFGNLIFTEVRGRELKHAASLESTAKQVWAELKVMGLDPQITDDRGLPMEMDEVDFETKMIEFYGLALTPKSGEPIIPVMDTSGKIRWYKMEPAVYKAVQSMSADGLEFLRKNNWARWAIDIGGLLPRHTARLFRAGTVGFRASFGLVTNPLRDFQTLYLNTASSANGLTLFANFLLSFGEEFVSAITGGRVRSKWSKLWLQLGGRMALPLSQDTDLVAQAARDVVESKNIGRRIVRYVTDPKRIHRHIPTDWRSFISFWKDFLQFPESATRMAEIRTVAAEMGWSPTMPDGKGGTQARPFTAEVMQKLILAGKQVTVDFTAAGEASRVLNTFIPFFNATIQGPRAALRAARRPVRMGKLAGIPTGPIHFATRGIQLAALAIANWYQNKDEDWWIRMNAREKFLYMYYPTNILGEDVVVMIPLAHDSGQLFAGLAVAFLDAWYRRAPDEVMKWTELSDFGFTIAESHSPIDLPFDFGRRKVAPTNVLGKGWQTVMELGMNRKSYFGTPVVSSTFLGPGGRDRIPREQQYNEYTTEAAKWLANLAGMSPVEIDHAITSVAGPAARDYLLAGQSLDGLFTGKKLESFSDVPVLGRVFRRGGKAGTRTRPVNDLYDAYELVYTRHGDRVKSETPEENREYMLLGDATSAVSLLFHIRAMTKDETKRREISNKASELAESALENIDTMRLDRDPFRLQETMLRRERDEMKMFRAYEQGNIAEGDKLRDALYKQRKNAESMLMRGFPEIEDATPAKRIEALRRRRTAAKIAFP